ncbi:MAG TPA: ABC transporter ATP-binding protein [Sedimentibacter sp.]|jgi:putative ABC transport system ATP-binding protein|nr:macrolide ABC transporter ATP-binding protein [Clostridiales bacterium]HOA19208.1 ABC transporter ATP-binding protein [Sedimentibacter sp.]HOG61988.1 ABC transporter ATP-binding protein [Sedimentibacter sp.]HOT21737.1 ABC transporter ATP-binding protein [Sedimentibacter sp.]HPB80123.1 ABC transporter ATP-binding protein [Sedimentibacter sp.]
MEKMIRIENLNKIYKNGSVEVHALNDVNMEVSRGEFLAVMGHSGSGKSTLMNIIGCLDRPSSGKYFLDGIEIDKQSPDELSLIRNKKIGFVFQAFNLIPRTNVLSNVELPMIYAKVKSKQRSERALELLEKVGLKDRINHMPNELSGGQMQRAAIARALANNPPIILADEPTGNLDTNSSEEIMKIFKDLNREGTSIIVVTHEPEVAKYADRIIVFKDGCIIEDRWKEGGRNYLA